MSLKRVEIIQTGPSVGDWTIQVGGVDITEMIDVITIIVNRAERKPRVLLSLSPDIVKVPKVLEAEVATTQLEKSKKLKDK